MHYCIRIQGHLDHYWREWFGNLEIIHEATGTSLLSGPLADQAALYGVLLAIRYRGLTLLSLEQDKEQTTKHDRSLLMTNHIEQNQSLKGQRLVILGGTSGIGLATAQLAASEGASIVVASSQQSSIDRALTLLPAGAEGYELDLTNEEAVKSFFERLGGFDHLIFTAGESLLVGELGSIELEQARQFYNLRFWGAFIAAKYGSSHIRPGGSIVLTSGAAGRRPAKGLVAVAPITSAVESLGRALAVELAPIRVNVICPGVVKTELWNTLPEEAREGFFQSTGQGLLVGRIGEAGDLAQSYLYALREGYSTGQVIVVDGGASLV